MLLKLLSYLYIYQRIIYFTKFISSLLEEEYKFPRICNLESLLHIAIIIINVFIVE
jgi:hypothetical protein